MSPRPQIDHIRRPQLLAAAAKVIAERGVAGARLADVAERAGTSPPAVLYWFASKDELLAEALTFEEESFYERLTGRLHELEHPVERLRLLIEESLDGNDWALWLELWSRSARDERTAAARRRLDERWRAEIAGIIRDGIAVGEFARADPEHAAITLASLMDGLAVQVSLEDPTVTPERAREIALSAVDRLLEPRAMAA